MHGRDAQASPRKWRGSCWHPVHPEGGLATDRAKEQELEHPELKSLFLLLADVVEIRLEHHWKLTAAKLLQLSLQTRPLPQNITCGIILHLTTHKNTLSISLRLSFTTASTKCTIFLQCCATRSSAAALHPNLLTQCISNPPHSLYHPGSVQKHSCLTHLFHQSHISLPSIIDQCRVLAPASGHFFHFSLAYHSSVLTTTTNQEHDLPSEFFTATYFRRFHKHPNSCWH